MRAGSSTEKYSRCTRTAYGKARKQSGAPRGKKKERYCEVTDEGGSAGGARVLVYLSRDK